jgi:glutamine---fructose-6-phosphate transaminase (isomerizing)
MAGLERLVEELSSQPAVVARVLAEQRAAVEAVCVAVQERDPAAIVLVARGSSDNAAVYGRYLFEVCNQRLTSLAAPSTVTLYGAAPRLRDTLVIGVSQSGQGEDVVAYVAEARRQGALTVALVNDTESPLARSAAYVLDCMAGPELSIPATKTVAAEMTLLAMLSVALDKNGLRFAELDTLPAALERAVQARPAAAQLARALGDRVIDSVIGRGFAFPPALEIALKLKETSYTPAEPYSAADFLHGPVALVENDFTALVVDVGGRSSEAAQQIAAGIGERGGRAVWLRVGSAPMHTAMLLGSVRTSGGDAPRRAPIVTAGVPAGADVGTLGSAPAGPPGSAPASADDLQLGLDVQLAEAFAPITALVLGQLLAVEVALARGLDPAQPRGLRKVTSTR